MRLLVIAAETLDGGDLREEISRHSGEREATVRIVFPALPDSRLKQVMGDVDEGIEEARRRRERELEQARAQGLEIEAQIGDADPVQAIEDALQTFSADEILVVTHDEAHSGPSEQGLFEQARDRFEPPLTHVVVRAGGVEETEHAGRGVESPEGERHGPAYTGIASSFSARDLAGIVVAIVGTIVLVLLAIDCPGRIEEGSGTSVACVVELIIAGAVALVNVAHVVALTLMSGAYRGPAERFFSGASLIGTPAAVVAVLLIGLIAD